MEISLAELADRIGAKVVGDADRAISGVAALDSASPDEITFVAGPKYISRLRTSKAAAAIVNTRVERLDMPQLVVDDVDVALLQVLSLFAEEDHICEPGVDPTARIGKDVTLGRGVGIGPHAVIGDGVAIGDDTFIAAGCTVGRQTRIGTDCRLYAGVAIYDRCEIGSRVLIQANAVIGSVGFGYKYIDGNHRLVPHIGNVVIEDGVEIGANTCVDRAKFGSTRIGAGTKIDNLVQIAHNVTMGQCCLVAGMTGIGGSCRLGHGVVLGGQVGVRDHITIGDGAMVGGKSFVMQNIAAGAQVFGYPAVEKNRALRIIHGGRRLPDLLARVGKLEAAAREQRQTPAPKEHRGLRVIGRVAAVLAAGVVVFLVWSAVRQAIRPWLDPDEVRVERMVANYQDGDDRFFVAAAAGLEDLRTNDRLFMMANLDQAIEQALADYGDQGDCYFLIPVGSMEQLRGGHMRDRLYLVTKMTIRDRTYALVTTEADRSFMRL